MDYKRYVKSIAEDDNRFKVALIDLGFDYLFDTDLKLKASLPLKGLGSIMTATNNDNITWRPPFQSDVARLDSLEVFIDGYRKNYFNEVRSESGLKIIFQDGVKINDLSDLEKTSNHWRQVILRGFVVLEGSSDTVFPIDRVSNGSIILEVIITGFNVVRSITCALIEISKLITASKELLIYSKNIRNINSISTEDEANRLERLSEIDVENQAVEISKVVINNYYREADVSPETLSTISKSIEGLIDHLKKGGEVQPFLNEAEKTEDSQDLLSQLNKEKQKRLDTGKKLSKIDKANSIDGMIES